MKEPSASVASIDLPSPEEIREWGTLTLSKRQAPSAKEKESGDAGYVNDGSVVSFAANVTAQNRIDTLNSVLLAQLAANKQFNREKQTDEWYELYTNTLGKLGWILQQFSFQKYDAAGNKLDVDQIVLQIIAAIATKNETAVVQQTLEKLKSLSKDNDQRFVLFDRASQADKAGNFQMAVANETNDLLAMKLGAFHFQSEQQTTRFLFASFATSTTTIYQSSQVITLNQQVYDRNRKLIEDKLGDRIQQLIADIDI